MKIANKLSNKWLLLSPVIGLGLLMPKIAWAVDPVTQWLGEAAFKVVLSPAWLILKLEMWLLPTVAQYNNFINEAGVVTGWIALRDVSNMMFILVLLVIAFATILRVRSYGYKQLLSRLIIIAILINFSRTFVGLAIDLSQVVMLTFVQAIKDVASGNIIVALGLGNIGAAGANPMSTGSYLGALILGAFMLVLAVVIIGVFIGMLAARIVTLWILIVLSPLAFLAYVFPRTQSYFNKWLSQLGTNLFSGPVLVFFLWLAFTITGRGDIATSFPTRPTGAAADDIAPVASADNVINYVIAMVLLVSSLKFVGASGAAGASLAARAHKASTDYASKLARRYPMATLSRIGALASRGVINEEGQARKLFGVVPWSRYVPFVGGRVQRAAQKMQGYDAARQQKDKEEDTKYIKATQRGEFFKSQKTVWADKKGWRKGLGAAYSTITSQGGNFDKDTLSAQYMVDRGEITHKNADWATNLLRRSGDEERMQKIQGEHWTFANKEEAMRLVRKKGINGLLGEFSSNNLYDDKGNAKEGAKLAIDALFDSEHGHADPNAIANATFKMTKSDRGGFANFVEHNFDFKRHLAKAETITGTSEKDGGLEPDKRGIGDNNLDNPAVVAALALAKIYPMDVGDEVDTETGDIKKIGADRLIYARNMALARQAFIKPGQIGSKLYKWHGETSKEFKERRSEADDLDRVIMADASTLPKYLRAQYTGEEYKDEKTGQTKHRVKEEFKQHRQGRYKQLLGIDPLTHDKTDTAIAGGDPTDDSALIREVIQTKDLKKKEELLKLYALKYTLPETMRTDILSQKETLAKEQPAGFAARQALFDKTENSEEYKRKYEKRLSLLRQATSVTPDQIAPNLAADYGENAHQDIITRMMSEVVDNNRVKHNWMSKTFWTEGQDGANGSRLAEVNPGNHSEASMLDHAIDSMEHGQQGEAFKVSTEAQTEYLVDRLVEYGKQPQKVLMENIDKGLAAQAMQTLNDVKSLESGVLPQSLRLLGQDLRKMAAVLQHLARVNKVGDTRRYIESEPAIAEWYSGMKALHSRTPEGQASFARFEVDLNGPIIKETLPDGTVKNPDGYAIQPEILPQKEGEAGTGGKSKKDKNADPTNPGGKSV